jgi:hypothetical protein
MPAVEVLTVRLEREGDVLRRSYSVPGFGHLKQHNSFGSWSDLDQKLQFGELVGLEGLAALLDEGGAENLSKYLLGEDLVAVGEVLFQVLFGKPEKWKPLLREAHQSDIDPTPAYRGLRISSHSLA